MNNTRYCQFQGHQENNTTYICTYKDCKLDSKWVCVDCMFQQIHNHGQPNQNHLMKQQQFLDYIKKQSQPMYDQKQEDRKLIQICIKGLQYFIQSTQFLIQKLKENLTIIEKNYNFKEIEEIINITKNNHFLLENQQIEEIINLNNYNKKYESSLSQDVLKQLIKLHQDLSKLLENNFKKQNLQINQENILEYLIIQPNAQLVYKIHFEYEQDNMINTSQISYDEKYLVIGGNDRKIQVYDIITKQWIKSIQICNVVKICRFTKDSKYLICGDSKGYLFFFDINDNFNQQYKNQIHSEWINDILPIDNDQIITCSYDKSITITNIKQKTQQLLIQNAHKDSILTIDYDQQNDVIISGSYDKSIKFFNRKNGEMYFEQYNAHDNGVCQIQLLSDKNNNLLSSGYLNLILWQIDYHKKQLNKIKVLDYEHYNFTSVDNNNRIILICNKVVQILDKNLNQEQLFKHNLNLGSHYIRTRQLNSMNYIIVTKTFYHYSEIQILKRI